MSEIVIRSEGLGKSYFIGHEGSREKYTTLRDVIARQARQVWQSSRRAWRGQAVIAGRDIEEFWALRDVSFEIKQGEVVGIIGRNGAGKSTVLKILSRITEPTEGRVTLRGRVASLLEVGTGFHPELTGRENIFLNGAILGMTRAEIKRKFDEIVAFAEADKFLDTPVKRYSSGMNIRLAFSVAAHLEPEILLVDEVLAVGDAQFQKKCLGKMRAVASSGRTVLFVSHNMAAVDALCSRGIVLQSGDVLCDCSIRDAVSHYLSTIRSTTCEAEVWDRDFVASSVRLAGLTVLSRNVPTNGVLVGDEAIFRIAYVADVPHRQCHFRIKVVNAFDQVVAKLMTDTCEDVDELPNGAGHIDCVVPAMNLMPGEYRLSLALKVGHDRVDFVADAGRFQVIPAAMSANGKLPDEGICILPCQWRQRSASSARQAAIV